MEAVTRRPASPPILRVLSRCAIVASISTLGLLAIAPSRAAEPTAAELTEAHTRFDKGLALFREGAFEAAAAEFERAYQLAPSFKILYDLGLAYARGHDPAAALRTFERYLRDGAESVPADRRASVERELADLQSRVARIRVEASVAGAAISLDDVGVGAAPLAEPLVVNPGRHRVAARVGDGTPVVEQVSVVGGESRTVAFALVDRAMAPHPEASTSASAGASTSTNAAPIASTPPSPAITTSASASAAVAPPQPPTRGASRTTIAWISSAIALAGGATLGGMALYESHQLSIARGADGQTRDGLDDLRTRTRVFAAGADVLFGTSIALAGLSLYWTYDDARSGESAPRPVVGVVVAPSRIVFHLEF